MQQDRPLPDVPLRLAAHHQDGKTLLNLGPVYEAVRTHEDDNAPLHVAVTGPGVNALTLAAALFAKLVDWGRPQLDLYIARPQLAATTARTDAANGVAEENYSNVADARNNTRLPDDCVVVGPHGPPDPFLAHRVVAVGGTFDRLHAGHRLLLCAAAWAAREGVRVGVTGAQLLRGKAHGGLIYSVDARAAAATAYVRRARMAAGLPDAVVLHTVLTDRSGPAASEPHLHALVVSHETMGGAPVINARRRELGLGELATVIVPVLHGAAGKLSSSALREKDARVKGGVGAEDTR